MQFSKKYLKLIIFVLTTIVFGAISLLSRIVLVNNYNGYDFIFFKIDYIKNYGAAFSLFHTHTSLLIAVSGLILVLTIYYIFDNIKRFTNRDILFSSLLCAGIVCNLAERIVDGFVSDYICIKHIAFPIFNVSDIYICIGAFALICNILFNNDNEQKK